MNLYVFEWKTFSALCLKNCTNQIRETKEKQTTNNSMKTQIKEIRIQKAYIGSALVISHDFSS